MKRNSILLLAVLASLNAAAQRFLTEVFPSFTKTANVTYGTNISVLTGSPVSVNLQCDVYEPAGATDTMARRPLIVLLHSGTFLPPYVNGQLEGVRNDSGLVELSRQFARRGYVVANIDYRLGWNPAGSSVDIRRGTLIQAAYRSVQDVKSAVRFFRKDAATTNTYRIDSNRVIIGGVHTGGLIAVNYAALTAQTQLNIPKYISNITDATYGFQAGQPFINPALIGDLDGYGGIAQLNNPNNSPGYNGKANFIFGYEAIVGDSSWITPGLPPMVAFHRVYNPQNQPYGNGIVYVNLGTPQAVVDVSGSSIFIPKTNDLGNNACFRPNAFTDVYTQKAMALSGGVEGLYPQLDSFAGFTWYDSVSTVSECLTYGLPLATCQGLYSGSADVNHKQQSLAYIDTLMGYLNPRIVRCLNLAPTAVPETGSPAAGIHIFPNPASGRVIVTAAGAGNGILLVELRDMAGRKVQETVAGKVPQVSMELSTLPKGLYFITVATQQATVTLKLVLL